VQGLIGLLGGSERTVAKLNELFQTFVPYPDKGKFLGQFPDMTGLIGMYSHGNEPSWHIPYLYNYTGAPWMTQRRVRQILNTWYDDTALGICGDEDHGEMSSWYVLSAMGFYQVSPGRPVYDIGSPIFSRVSIALGRGRTFTIQANGTSRQNKYVQSATLNGENWNRPWFSHEALRDGGKLELTMGSTPNRDWGTSDSIARRDARTGEQRPSGSVVGKP